MNRYAHLATRLFNAPLMLRLAEAEAFAAVFNQLVLHVGLPAAAAPAARPEPAAYAVNRDSPRYANKPFVLTDDGVGILPVYGPMTQRAELKADCSEFTSYQRLARQFELMLADPDVKGILLEMDSPGGEVAGNFDLAAKVRAAAKPVWAHANEGAYSAGYSLAASAQRLDVAATGSVGSIGVLMMHVDQSAKDAKAGYAYTPIFAGSRKVDFNPHAPLTKEALALGQAEVDRLYDVFVAHVAAMRGIKADAVRATEAGILAPADAVALKLADRVQSFDDTLAEFTASLKPKTIFSTGGTTTARRTSPQGGTMHDPQGAAAQPQEEQLAAATAKARAEGEAAGRTAERARIAAILNAPEAEGRSKMAATLALETDMEAATAAKVLGAAAKETAAAPSNPLAQAMASVTNPNVGADAGQPDPAQAAGAGWDRSFGKINPARAA